MDFHRIADCIGNTPLVPLERIVPAGSANVLVKLEGQNPTGSMKDRMALGVISRAEETGRLSPGRTVVDYTGGSTGASLALICAAKGYTFRAVSSKAFSQEKLDQMTAYGAHLTLVPYDGGGITKQLIRNMIETAQSLSRETNGYWVNQLHNVDSIAGYYPLGEEIWRQTNGRIDAFVQSVGTAASLNGVAEVLKRHNPEIRIVAVEPEESAVLSGGGPGAHDIEGIGIGYRPPLWDPRLVDEVVPVSTNDAKAMARELALREGVFAGTSSGGNVRAAMAVAEKLGSGATVVTLAVDSGLKYLSTNLYRTGPNLPSRSLESR